MGLFIKRMQIYVCKYDWSAIDISISACRKGASYFFAHAVAGAINDALLCQRLMWLSSNAFVD